MQWAQRITRRPKEGGSLKVQGETIGRMKEETQTLKGAKPPHKKEKNEKGWKNKQTPSKKIK
jgi:hypothetical protein